MKLFYKCLVDSIRLNNSTQISTKMISLLMFLICFVYLSVQEELEEGNLFNSKFYHCQGMHSNDWHILHDHHNLYCSEASYSSQSVFLNYMNNLFKQQKRLLSKSSYKWKPKSMNTYSYESYEKMSTGFTCDVYALPGEDPLAYELHYCMLTGKFNLMFLNYYQIKHHPQIIILSDKHKWKSYYGSLCKDNNHCSANMVCENWKCRCPSYSRLQIMKKLVNKVAIVVQVCNTSFTTSGSESHTTEVASWSTTKMVNRTELKPQNYKKRNEIIFTEASTHSVIFEQIKWSNTVNLSTRNHRREYPKTNLNLDKAHAPDVKSPITILSIATCCIIVLMLILGVLFKKILKKKHVLNISETTKT